jgi:truncated hemoglobin YjbI
MSNDNNHNVNNYLNNDVNNLFDLIEFENEIEESLNKFYQQIDEEFEKVERKLAQFNFFSSYIKNINN